MNYEPFPEDLRKQCKKMTLTKDIIGGVVKAGTIIWTYHKFRIYIPKDPKQEKPTAAARYEFDGQLFDSYFVPWKAAEKEPAK